MASTSSLVSPTEKKMPKIMAKAKPANVGVKEDLERLSFSCQTYG